MGEGGRGGGGRREGGGEGGTEGGREGRRNSRSQKGSTIFFPIDIAISSFKKKNGNLKFQKW